jgi:hypothetical protein
MNKRCIVNVATGEFYCKMQERLVDSFKSQIGIIIEFGIDGYVGKNQWNKDGKCDLILWVDCLPSGSRPHSESPYGFKVHAIKAAYERGYTSILWLDSPAYAVKEDISPIFEKIEKEGYYAMSHIDPLENWVGEFTLAHFAMRRDLLKGYNLPSGSCYGFDFSKPHIETLFDSMCTKERQGFFNSETISEGGWHRHDESVLAMLLIQFGLPIFTHDPLFQSTDPSCVIRSGELLDLTPNI